ncbi:MAG: UDP-N-acetyl-D-mannosamine dehydrogenase [bacterium]|nr:UDP-N-acetyl-D-mannosamine dehydrogenase [bacterium]
MSEVEQRQVCVVGLGYTGLPTAAVLASRGYQVHGVEVNAEAVETINAGRAHIVEPDLDMLVRAAVGSGRLRAHVTPAEADVFLLCVPTPCSEDKEPILDHVLDATRSIAPFVRAGNLVILESTSPPGTTERLAGILSEETGLASGDLHVAHAPERVLPGRILHEVIANDRIVGGVSAAATEACAAFYSGFVTGEVLRTTARTAETVKLAENAYRDVNIAFANEIALVADELDVDVWELIELANRHPRVEVLRPGPGVGGHCIAVDPWFLIHAAPESTALMQAARRVNLAKPGWVVERVKRRAQRFRNPRIACLGLTYKAGVDDLRQSPALEIVRELARAEVGELRVVEPNLAHHDEFALVSWQEALEGADIVLFLVPHPAFARIPRGALEERVLIDTCGILRG